MKLHRKYEHNSRKKLREKVIKKLGGTCVICGFSDPRALQIDHINGGGCREHKLMGHAHLFLHRVLEDDGTTYQLLCANCNWIKRTEKNEVAGGI